MKVFRNRGLAACMGLVLSTTLVACGGSGAERDEAATSGAPEAVDAGAWADIEAAANEEGAVTAYVSLTGMEPVFDDFMTDYPDIDVTLEQVPTADLLPRLDQELSVGAEGADFTFHAAPGWFVDNFESGNFLRLQLSPDVQDTGGVERLGDNNFAGVYGFPNVISYRTSEPRPETIEQLLETNPDARIGLVDPRRSSPAVSYQYQVLQEAAGDDIMERLSEANVTVVPSNPQLTEGLAAGDYDYAYPDIASITNAVIAEGAPIEVVVPEGDSVAGVEYNAAIPYSAPNSNAAQVLLNWMMSERGAASFAEHLQPAVTPVAVDGSLDWDSVNTFEVSDWTTEAQETWIADNFVPYFG